MGLGLTLGDLLKSEAQAAGEDWRDVAKQSKPGKAKNIILAEDEMMMGNRMAQMRRQKKMKEKGLVSGLMKNF